MDIKEIHQQYELEIEAWHLFYQSFLEHEMYLDVARGILVRMTSELLQAKQKNPTSEKILNTQLRLEQLEKCLDKMDGLNSRCVSLQKQLKKSNAKNFELQQEIELLTSELNAIKLID